MDTENNEQTNNDVTLPLAQTKLQKKLWDSLQPVCRVAASDTYKRTMSGSSDHFANSFTAYQLAARKPLKEEGADGRLIMAGMEKMLYTFFRNPIEAEEITNTKEFFKNKGSVDKFPDAAWQKVIDNDGYMPVDIWALPGGQTFLAKDGKHVPMMSVEGVGALVSHLEPHFEQAHSDIIYATKARLMKEAVGTAFAEFGLRSDRNTNNHSALMLALYVGGGLQLTSSDQAVMLFNDYFKDIGTVGHEFIMAYQKEGRSLEESQKLAFEDFIRANQRSALLPDVINTLESGFPAILDQVLKNPEKDVMPRLDSGDIIAQAVHWAEMTKKAGVKTQLVVEDGYNPVKARETILAYKNAGHDPLDIIVGAGGYFQDGCTRDAISLAYKRSATVHEGKLEVSLKFSDSPGKESIPGKVRIYGKGNTMIVAQEGESIDGTPLMVQVVKNGRIMYNEKLEDQLNRSDKSWDEYSKIEYSTETQRLIDERLKEKDDFLAGLKA